jgi:hypothetical protein
MFRRILLFVVTVLASASVSSAHAGVPIPCTATRFIKAPELPSAKDLSGQRIELYYNMSGCTGSQWDGYKSLDGKYNRLSPNLLATLPKAPGFWASAWQHKARFWVEWLWLFLAAFVVVGTLLSKLSEKTGPGQDHPVTASVSTPR